MSDLLNVWLLLNVLVNELSLGAVLLNDHWYFNDDVSTALLTPNGVIFTVAEWLSA